MDFLGVKPKNKKTNNGKKRGKKDDVKVVHISSPIMVKTSASEFRALVQELTGKDSDIAETHFFHAENNYNSGSSNSPSKSYESPSSSEYSAAAAAFELSDDRRDDHQTAAVLPDDLMFGDVSFMEMLSSSTFFNDDQSYGY